MNRNLLFVFAILSVAVLGLQMAEPVAAVKVIDKRVLNCPSGTQDFNSGKYVFTTYRYNNNVVWVNIKGYESNGVCTFSSWTQLKKVSTRTLRIKGQSIEGGWIYTYKTTSYSAVKYYWKVYRPQQTVLWTKGTSDRYWS
jgi:hypothetical protein